MLAQVDIFSIVPIEAAMDDRLSKTQLRVLIALLSFRGRNTNTVWPSREKLAERAGMPAHLLHKVSTTTSELVALGWLVKVGNGGRNRPTEYRITVPDLATKTVPDSGTVPKSETVPESGTKTVPESGTKTVPDSGTGIELTSEQTKEVTSSVAGDRVIAVTKLLRANGITATAARLRMPDATEALAQPDGDWLAAAHDALARKPEGVSVAYLLPIMADMRRAPAATQPGNRHDRNAEFLARCMADAGLTNPTQGAEHDCIDGQSVRIG